MDNPSHTGDEIGEDIEKRFTVKEIILMNTTVVRAAIHERVDPIIEAMITRELMRQSTPSWAIPSMSEQPGAQFAAFAPALIAILASQQPQQVPIQRTQSPLEALLPVLVALLAGPPQQVPVQRPQSPLATLLPVLVAFLPGQQPQPARPSPLISALSAALAPVIASALTGRLRGKQEEERKEGEGKQEERKEEEHREGEGKQEEGKEREAGEGSEKAGQ
jgi:hypothetical protein